MTPQEKPLQEHANNPRRDRPRRRRLARGNLPALRAFKLRLLRERVVTITVHDDDEHWSRCLSLAAGAGFELVPGSMILSTVNQTPKGLVVTHVAHLLKPEAFPAPAEQPRPARPPPAGLGPNLRGDYRGVEFG